VTVILAQVSVHVCRQIPNLLVRTVLSRREPIEAVGDVPEAVGDVPEAVSDVPELQVRTVLRAREPIEAVSDVPELVGDMPDLIADVPEAVSDVAYVVSKVSNTIGDVSDDGRQADDPFCHSVGFCGEPFKICRKLCLLMQQKLHGPFNLLGGHRLKLHDAASSSFFSCHYAIVLPQVTEQAECRPSIST
jgi:hypothetical protein